MAPCDDCKVRVATARTRIPRAAIWSVRDFQLALVHTFGFASGQQSLLQWIAYRAVTINAQFRIVAQQTAGQNVGQTGFPIGLIARQGGLEAVRRIGQSKQNAPTVIS